MLILAVVTAISIAIGSDASDVARAGFSFAMNHPSVRDAAERRLIVDRASSATALRKAFPGDSLPLQALLPGRAVSEGKFSALSKCTDRPRRRCQLPSDILFMQVTSAKRQSASSVIVRLDVAYQASDSALSSQSMTLLLERVKGQWQVTKFISGTVG